MAGSWLRRVLVPAVRRLDRAGRTPHQDPTPAEASTRFPQFPWDLRTLIAVFPPESPFRFLNLNTLLGMTGVPFDRVERWPGDPADALDLQFCLEGRTRFAAYKQYHSVSQELSYDPEAVRFQLGERLHFAGAWPSYTIRYEQPEIALELAMQFESWPDFHWWAYFPGVYFHYTSFGDCRFDWKWGGEQGRLTLPALHDHGWGRNLLPLRLPLRVFRYEVLRLPAGGFAISLWTEAPPGLEIKCVGLHRPDRDHSCFMDRYHCQVLEWDTFANYVGRPCRVPRRWIGLQQGANAEFRYEAVRASEPRPVLGDGFLYAFDYQGEGRGCLEGKVAGEGYVEQLGRL